MADIMSSNAEPYLKGPRKGDTISFATPDGDTRKATVVDTTWTPIYNDVDALRITVRIDGTERVISHGDLR